MVEAEGQKGERIRGRKQTRRDVAEEKKYYKDQKQEKEGARQT